jgi:hypothetical protein
MEHDQKKAAPTIPYKLPHGRTLRYRSIDDPLWSIRHFFVAKMTTQQRDCAPFCPVVALRFPLSALKLQEIGAKLPDCHPARGLP